MFFAAPPMTSFQPVMQPMAPPSYDTVVLDPNGPRSQTNLFVRKLASAVTENDLHRLFCQFGTIVSFALMRHIHTGESLGIAFIRYDTHDEAKAAMSALDGKELYGRPISIQWAKKHHDGTPIGEDRKKIHKLFVRNIPLDVKASHLQQLFGPFGEISNVTIHGDTAPPTEHHGNNGMMGSGNGNGNGSRVTQSQQQQQQQQQQQPQRNIAFILFQDDGAAEEAVRALHNVCAFDSCDGIPLMVKLAEDNRQRLERRQRFGDPNSGGSNGRQQQHHHHHGMEMAMKAGNNNNNNNTNNMINSYQINAANGSFVIPQVSPSQSSFLDSVSTQALTVSPGSAVFASPFASNGGGFVMAYPQQQQHHGGSVMTASPTAYALDANGQQTLIATNSANNNNNNNNLANNNNSNNGNTIVFSTAAAAAQASSPTAASAAQQQQQQQQQAMFYGIDPQQQHMYSPSSAAAAPAAMVFLPQPAMTVNNMGYTTTNNNNNNVNNNNNNSNNNTVLSSALTSPEIGSLPVLAYNTAATGGNSNAGYAAAAAPRPTPLLNSSNHHNNKISEDDSAITFTHNFLEEYYES